MLMIANANAPIIAATVTAIIAYCLSLFIRRDRVSAFEASRFRSLRRSRFEVVATVDFFQLVRPCGDLMRGRGGELRAWSAGVIC